MDECVHGKGISRFAAVTASQAGSSEQILADGAALAKCNGADLSEFMQGGQGSKDLYRELRALSWDQLWLEEVARFDRAGARERFERVAVIRAVGAVFPESGPPGQREEVRSWLASLLSDPEEKVRRYAMAALPKIGAGAEEEARLLDLLRQGTGEREAKFVGRALDKIGGAATLEALESTGLTPQTEQKVRASLARGECSSSVALGREVPGWEGRRVHLRGRKGLEEFVRQEAEEQGRFRVIEEGPGWVALEASGPFTLGDVYRMRCFGTAGLVLGRVERRGDDRAFAESLASLIAAPASQRLFRTLTEGPLRYRLEFVAKGHQRGAVRAVANRAFALCPEILNDSRAAPWSIDVHPAGGGGEFVELRPRLSPDPRLAFRLGDVPAASHPPLAACMARLAGARGNEMVWDPFCGSGLELIERCLRGGVRRVYGTDRSAEAVAIARRNLGAAPLGPAEEPRFHGCDFRELPRVENLAPGSLTLVVTNPPLGRRVPIPNLRGLFDDLFALAASLLAVDGRLVLTNPFPDWKTPPSFQLDFRQVVDLGGFTCRLERYRKRGAGGGGSRRRDRPPGRRA